jgi:hypothetical protein
MIVLAKKGYEQVNKLNEKYNITEYEITNMEEFKEFRDAFYTVAWNSSVIKQKDIDIMDKMCNKLDES